MDTGIVEPLRALTAPSSGRRMRVGVGALVVLLLVALGCATLITALSPTGSAEVLRESTGTGQGALESPDARAAESESDGGPLSGAPDASSGDTDSRTGETPRATTIFVHVLGAVARPGLYEVHDNARVIDVIASAGGLADAADTARVNLARRISDGEQLYVPAIGEVAPSLAPAPSSVGGAPGVGEAAASVVNLNSATVTDLDSLPRIGPALAQRILDWRESNGRFTSVDDLLGVPGIGDKIVEGLRPLVTV